MFTNLIEKSKNFNYKKKSKIKISLATSILFLRKNAFIIVVLQINFLYKPHSHVCYTKAY